MPDDLLACVTPKQICFDDSEVSYGSDLKPAIFRLPEAIPEAWVENCRRAVQLVQPLDRPACEVPGGKEAIELWLAGVISGVAHNLDDPSLDLRIEALAEQVEDYPLWCFRRKTRKLARNRFKFLPVAQELEEFIQEMDNQIRRPMAGVMQIAQAGPRRRKRQEDDDDPPHQRPDYPWNYDKGELRKQQIAEETHRRRKADIALMEARDRPPIRQANENDDMFVARCTEHSRSGLDTATKFMRRLAPRTKAEEKKGRGRSGGLTQIGSAAADVDFGPDTYAPSIPTEGLLAKRQEMTERAIEEAEKVRETLAGKEKGSGDEKSDAA